MSISLNNHETRIKKLEQTSVGGPSYSVYNGMKTQQDLYKFSTPDIVVDDMTDDKYIGLTIDTPGTYIALYSTYNYKNEFGVIKYNDKIIARTPSTVSVSYFNGSCYAVVNINKSDVIKFQHSTRLNVNEFSTVLVRIASKTLYYKVLEITSSFIKEVLL